MSEFLNLAKQGYEAYQRSQSDVSKTGGEEYNSDSNQPQGQGQGQGGPQFDHDEVVDQAVDHAQQHGGGGDRGMFSQAMSFAQNNHQQHNQPVDEEHVVNSHQQAYQGDGPSGMSASSMGSAAAMQILQKFTSGGAGGGGGQSQLISMAMAEASKLFDSAGGASSGNKQDAVNGAAMTVMKLLVQSKFSGAMGGGNSGGLGSLMGMASKFM